jgi:hypothetical protein
VSGSQEGKNIEKNIYFRADFLSIYRITKLQIDWIGSVAQWTL